MQYTPVRVTAPMETPVDLDWIKAQLRVDHEDDDEVLEGLIQAATDYFDGWDGILGRALVTQTWRIDLADFPRCEFLRLPLAPVQSVTSLSYYDSANIQQTFAPSAYALDADAEGSFVILNGGYSWPSVYARRGAARLSYVVGYGLSDAVPAPIKSAIKLHIEMHYDTGVDQAVWQQRLNALIAPFRPNRIL